MTKRDLRIGRTYIFLLVEGQATCTGIFKHMSRTHFVLSRPQIVKERVRTGIRSSEDRAIPGSEEMFRIARRAVVKVMRAT